MITKTLRRGLGTGLILIGLAVVTVGSALVYLGAWINDVEIDHKPFNYDDPPDITDDELAQIIKDAREAERHEP